MLVAKSVHLSQVYDAGLTRCCVGWQAVCQASKPVLLLQAVVRCGDRVTALAALTISAGLG